VSNLSIYRRAPSIAVIGEPLVVPAIVAAGGKSASERFFEFFAANIRNLNTREAYYRAVVSFFAWAEARELRTLASLRPIHVAAYVEGLTRTHSPGSVKQALAAVRMLFDWFVTGQIVPVNPAHAVRGPKHVVSKGKTPVLAEDEARRLLSSIDISNVVGLRDRALIGTMLYTFARVEAAVGMNVEDYFIQGRRSWLRLQEKGGKQHEMPAHHKLEAFLDAYIEAAGTATDKKWPLFLTAASRAKRLTPNRMSRKDAWRMIRRRATDAGIETPIGCHSFRATGITNYLENGGTLEKAQKMAAHSSARTTKLYDRRDDQVTLDEIERIAI
jgi:site-specific recombinase XerD